ncbi:MAG: porin, partial [Pseudomonas sp.]|nr:porin [Pseudomonas sp.]
MIRKHFAGFVASALALAVSAQAFAGTVTTDGTDIVVKTKGGLEVFTTDKEYSFKLGGRIQADFDQFDGFYTANNNSANEAYFRRAILELTGNYKDWRYVFNYDFANGQANNGAGGVGGSGTNGSGSNNWDEASIAYTGFAPVTIKVGRFDPDFGLQHATSSKWTTFIERAAIYDLAPWVNNKQD